jgi:hypothetical protein
MKFECIKIETVDQFAFPEELQKYRYHLQHTEANGASRRMTLCGVDTSRFTAAQFVPDYKSTLFQVCLACKEQAGLEVL